MEKKRLMLITSLVLIIFFLIFSIIFIRTVYFSEDDSKKNIDDIRVIACNLPNDYGQLWGIERVEECVNGYFRVVYDCCDVPNAYLTNKGEVYARCGGLPGPFDRFLSILN